MSACLRWRNLAAIWACIACGLLRRAFETGRTKPLGVTRAAIKQALEKAGVEFLDGDGVRLRK
jgi:hypothetical protein